MLKDDKEALDVSGRHTADTHIQHALNLITLLKPREEMFKATVHRLQKKAGGNRFERYVERTQTNRE